MKKVALVFALAVIAPSLVLAWLALRSLRDQEYAADRRQTLLYQNLADSKAAAVEQHVTSAQRAFAYSVENMCKTCQSRQLAEGFDARLRDAWPLAEVGFAVSLNGGILAPSLPGSAEARKFRVENDRFLCSTESCEVYWNSPKGPISLAALDAKEAMIRSETSSKSPKGERTVLPVKEAADMSSSKLSVGETNFRELVGSDTDGMFARFLQDKLHVMFWHRASDDPLILFGAQVSIPRLAEELRDYVSVAEDLNREVCLALLDHTGKPVALSHSGFNPSRQRLDARVSANGRTDWKHPFVAAEIGEALPHWEVAVYLLDPTQVVRSASAFKITLGLLIALLLLAIAVGSWLLVADLNRQLRLARQKTDFVSNVSHELKTPLTSIRMFTEMLAEERVNDPAKRRQFLGIITAETARLTRLINNVLDFARIERGEKNYQFAAFDVAALVSETVESYRPHLEALGFTLRTEIPPEPLTCQGDRDAIAQVLVNLLSNAEKYSGDGKEVVVVLDASSGGFEIRVLDRGLGVLSGCEEKIFDQFYRAHDSLSCGIQGSGLGLTLARQIARAHGGEVAYQAREGGGSCFILKLPHRSQRNRGGSDLLEKR